MSIRWMRIILGALLLELVLLVTLVPLSVVNMTLFLTAVPIGGLRWAELMRRTFPPSPGP